MRTRRAAFRFFAVWGSQALLCFIAAGVLTEIITYFNHDRKTRPHWGMNATPEEQEVGVFPVSICGPALRKPTKPSGRWPKGPEDLTACADEEPFKTHVHYSYDEGTKTSSISVFMAGAHLANIVLNHLAGPNACVYEGSDEGKPVPLVPLKPSGEIDRPTRGAYLVKLRRPREAWFTCKLDSIVERETYTARQIMFFNLRGSYDYLTLDGYELHEEKSAVLNEKDLPWPIQVKMAEWGMNKVVENWGSPTKWNLDVSGMKLVQGMTFVGAALGGYSLWDESVVQLGSTRDVLTGDDVILRWESVSQESRRDIIIVVIGALIALGAAMLLEAVRPFAEAWAGARELGGSKPVPPPADKDAVANTTATPHDARTISQETQPGTEPPKKAGDSSPSS